MGLSTKQVRNKLIRTTLLFSALVAIIVFGATHASTPQTPQVQDFKLRVLVDCNFHPIEEIDANGVKSLSIYYYDVEFLTNSITCENCLDNDKMVVTLHNAFLYKHTYRNIYGKPHTEYFDPAEHPENFFRSITIYPPSYVCVGENYTPKNPEPACPHYLK